MLTLTNDRVDIYTALMLASHARVRPAEHMSVWTLDFADHTYLRLSAMFSDAMHMHPLDAALTVGT